MDSRGVVYVLRVLSPRMLLVLLVGLYGLAASFPCPDPGFSEDREVLWQMSDRGRVAAVESGADESGAPVMRMACPCGYRHAASAVSAVGVYQSIPPTGAEVAPVWKSDFRAPAADRAAPLRSERPEPIPKLLAQLS